MMVDEKLLDEAQAVLAREPRLIRLADEKVDRVVFVGDTHGDLDASERVVEGHWSEGMVLVFLGDYVDRGPRSRENLEYLLKLKLEHPQRVYLLQGNHEGWAAFPFSPADFWKGLPRDLRQRCAGTLAHLPLALALPNGVLALHGALPSVERLEEIEEIAVGSDAWRQIVWGDWQDAPGLWVGELGGRPQFGRGHFDEEMEAFGMRVLVRSHQPHAPPYLFDDRCLTIFTSRAYGPRERTVAIASLDREIRTARDLVLKDV